MTLYGLCFVDAREASSSRVIILAVAREGAYARVATRIHLLDDCAIYLGANGLFIQGISS